MRYPRRADRANYTDFTCGPKKSIAPVKKFQYTPFKKVVMCAPGIVVVISAISWYLYWRN